MDDSQQQLNEVVSDLLPSQMAVGGNECVADRLGMPAQFVQFLADGTLAVATEDLGSKTSKQVRWEFELAQPMELRDLA